MRGIALGLIFSLLAAKSPAEEPLSLLPASTLIVVPDGPLPSDLGAAARLLQTYLRQTLGARDGFSVLAESQVAAGEKRAVLALGPTRWSAGLKLAGLWRDGFIIRRTGSTIVIVGGQARGTFNGAVAFLDRVCGVRFYMPGKLFTHVPRRKNVQVGQLDLVEEPYVRATSMSGASGPGVADWLRSNNALSRTGLAGTHQHSMWEMFPPEKYAAQSPEIYPILQGQRYIPRNARDQAWQPCFSEPKLIDAARESIDAHFAAHPEHIWVALSIQDSRVMCQCARCNAFYDAHRGRDPTLGMLQAYSEIYWGFMNRVAPLVAAKHPGKLLCGLAYGTTRQPPAFKLQPNILVFTNFHVAELPADGFIKAQASGKSRVEEWLAVASHYGNHDWHQGFGYLMPRIYSGFWSDYLRHLKARTPITYQHAEAYPNWGLDGPKLYVLGRQWWNPDVDPQAVWRQLCDDLFGRAGKPMFAYFTKLEGLWTRLDTVEGPERKIARWSTQFVTSAVDRQDIRQCRALLDEAKALAGAPLERQRIELFSKTFRLSEYLFELAAAAEVHRRTLDELRAYVRDVIAPDPMTVKRISPQGLTEAVEAAIKALTAKKRVLE